jgi:hypothetical protein
MATVRELQERLAQENTERGESRRTHWRLRNLSTISAESFAWEAEKRVAPVIAKNALLAMLGEARRTTRWARLTFWIACTSLVVSIGSLVIVLYRG